MGDPDTTPHAPERRLAPEELRWRCDPARFGFETTAEIADCPIRIIGQPRAQAALELGLALRSKGFNVFVSGEVGSGRSTVVGEMVDAAAAETAGDDGPPRPDDLVYVHNFTDPDRPGLQRFAAGRGKRFRAAMEELVEGFRRDLPKLFEAADYRARRTSLIERVNKSQQAVLKEFEKLAESQGFTLAQVQLGPVVRSELVPVIAGDPVDFDELDKRVEQGAMPAAEVERLRSSQVTLQAKMELVGKQLRTSDREMRRRLRELDREFARPLVEDAIAEIREAFGDRPVGPWLDAVGEDILESLDAFREPEGEEEQHVDDPLERYEVNVLVDNAETTGRPVIWETAPTARNLFGTIDKHRTETGDWETDHTRIKAGSLLRANGGFLVLDALDVLGEPAVWSALKRTLRHRKVELQSVDAFPFVGISLAPEAVAIDVKIVMIGTRQIYRVLYALDEDFKKIFKIKAEFTTETPLSDEELYNYACLVQRRSARDELPPFHRDAVAAIAERGARLAERQDKLTTRFSRIADLVREAGYWAGRQEAEVVRAEHVRRAIEQQAYRVDLVEEVLRERIGEGQVLIDLDGEQVGQVNGLAVLGVADHEFALPSRITATVAVGRLGIIDVERGAEMSGSLHTKGVLILSGFLRRRFAQDRPLALTASIAFEQTYGGVDGDSASSTELYALLSALAGVPLRQGIAVTGSVNQRGEVQAIGGVNEKVEGFFDLCRLRGLTGRQGVMIPAANRVQLMLRPDVVRAVAEGRFSVWSVATVDEGLEVLAGDAPGERGDDGRYPAGSFYGRVDARLGELAEAGRRFGLLGRDAEA